MLFFPLQKQFPTIFSINHFHVASLKLFPTIFSINHFHVA